MKKNVIKSFIVILFTAAIMTAGCNSSSKKAESEETTTEVEYTCPMHPEVVQASAGACPECGMDLVKKE